MGTFLDNSLINVVDKEILDNNQESLCFDDMRILLNDLKYFYISSNSKHIDLIRDQVIKKFSSVSNIHDDYVFVLRSNIEKYNKINRENVATLEDLGRVGFDGR